MCSLHTNGILRRKTGKGFNFRQIRCIIFTNQHRISAPFWKRFSAKSGKNISSQLSFSTSLHHILPTIAHVLPTLVFSKQQSNVIFTPPNSQTNEPHNIIPCSTLKGLLPYFFIRWRPVPYHLEHESISSGTLFHVIWNNVTP